MSHRGVSIEKLAFGYGEGVLGLTYDHLLPSDIFNRLDHISISVPGPEKFAHYLVKQVLPNSCEAVAVEVYDDLVIDALLKRDLDLHVAGTCDRVRVTQRDPDGEGVAVDYAAFWVEDLAVAEAVIKAGSTLNPIIYGIEPQRNLRLKDPKRPNVRVRFVDMPQERLVQLKLAEGQARIIDLDSDAPNMDRSRAA